MTKHSKEYWEGWTDGQRNVLDAMPQDTQEKHKALCVAPFGARCDCKPQDENYERDILLANGTTVKYSQPQWELEFDEKFIKGLNFYALQLSPRETKIFEMRFGKTDGVTHTLEEVGKEFGVTRERIRQIEEKAMEKLRQKEEIKSFIKDLIEKEREKAYEKAVTKLALGAKKFDTKQTRTQTIDELRAHWQEMGWVEKDPDILDGIEVLRGTRIPIGALLYIKELTSLKNQ